MTEQTPMQRMRALGWESCIDEQTGDATWIKRAALSRPGGDWVRGEYGCTWDADLAACSRTPEKTVPAMTEKTLEALRRIATDMRESINDLIDDVGNEMPVEFYTDKLSAAIVAFAYQGETEA